MLGSCCTAPRANNWLLDYISYPGAELTPHVLFSSVVAKALIACPIGAL